MEHAIAAVPLAGGPDGELVAERRDRAGRAPRGVERIAALIDGGAFLVAALALALAAPTTRSPSALVVAVLVLAYAVASRVEFEIAAGAAVPTQLVFVPMLFVLPAPLVPLAAAAGFVLGHAPDYVSGRLHPERAIGVSATAWYAMGPALVIVLVGERAPAWSDAPLYLGLLAAHVAVDVLHATVRERLALGIPPRALLRPLAWVALVDALLAPTGLLLAVAVAPDPTVILLVLPLLALLAVFARERSVRIDHALELTGVHASNRELDVLARRDPLTGIANRRAWDEELPRLLERAAAEELPLCVAILDLDHFKRYNDTQGHLRGDGLLVDAAETWGAQLRAGDLLARYGGEEFGLVLPGCSLADALRLLERLRAVTPGGQTCSIGVVQWNRVESALAVVKRADAALYAAKKAGRNRLVTV